MRTSNANLTVTRVNENEFHPIFNATQYTVHIPETTNVSTVVTTVTAADEDLGVNGTIFYSITTPGFDSIFRVNQSTGQIHLLSSLDFEQQTRHQFFVYASNQPDEIMMTPNSSVLVIIEVTNVDDTSPVFSSRNYHFNLLENSTEGSTLFTFNCTDADTGDDSLRYGFSNSDHGPFLLDPMSGEMSAAEVPTHAPRDVNLQATGATSRWGWISKFWPRILKQSMLG